MQARTQPAYRPQCKITDSVHALGASDHSRGGGTSDERKVGSFLSVVASAMRGAVLARLSLASLVGWAASDPLRPVYHFTPPSGWFGGPVGGVFQPATQVFNLFGLCVPPLSSPRPAFPRLCPRDAAPWGV